MRKKKKKTKKSECAMINAYLMNIETMKDIYLQKMISYFRECKGNLYSWLLSLPLQDLRKFSQALESENESTERETAITLAVMAHCIEKGKDGREFTETPENFCKAIDAFLMACLLAEQEKIGISIVHDDSYFFDIDNSLKIKLTKAGLEYGKKLHEFKT